MDAVRSPEGYPTTFETDVALTDGATLHVRPIRPDDGPRLLDFHERQSPQSIYYRYFSPRPRLSERDLEHLTHVDYVDRFALVALRADEVIGVARYDRLRHRAEAEVAFFVDDANHGRGLATVLLEHLAARAREVGITGFTASVLPENRKMIGVFTQAGFEATTRFDDGVVAVRLGLQPTPEAEAAIEARARRAASEAVRRLLSPTSVALIGASRRAGTIGADVLHNLQRAGFNGPIWPVNPEARHLGGIPAVASILDIPGEVDLAIVAVPAEGVAAVVEECGRKQVYGVVILSAGFAEQGAEGTARQAEVLRVARSWGVRIVGPSCLGIINTDPDVRLHATFANVAPLAGRVSLLSESGMVGAAIVGRGREEGVGFSSFVALGNRADVSPNDLLEYWTDDDATDVVCLYIESFGNPRHFSRQVRRLARRKPVLAVKAGGLPTSMAGIGRDLTEDALLRHTGVMRVRTLPDLLDTARLLTRQPLPSGRRVAIVGNAGGSLAIAADAAHDAGLVIAEIAPATQAVIDPLASHTVGAVAVVDLGLTAGGPEVERATAALAADPGVDVILVLYAPSLGGTGDEVRDAVDRARAHHPQVTVAACMYGPLPTPAGAGSVPVYDAVDAAAGALGRVAEYSEWLAQPEGDLPELDPVRAAAARALVDGIVPRGPTNLLDGEALAILDAVGFTVLPTEVVPDQDAAVAAASAIGYPVVIKAARRERTAKTAAAGFAIDLEGPEAVRAAWARMADTLGDDLPPALVQPMVAPGTDVSVAVHHHPTVGPVLSLGPGGAASALDEGLDVRVLPLGDAEVDRLVASGRLAEHLDDDGRAQLAQVVRQVVALVEALPELVDLELNPVIIGGGEAVVTQARATVAPVPGDPGPPIRQV